MRLFVAIGLPKEVKDHLFDIQKIPKEAKINWVYKKNMHLTLKFLGEVEEKDLDLIREKLSRIKHEPFGASLGDFGSFSTDRKIRVLWVSVIPEKKVIELQQKIDEELLDLFPGDAKFQSHITLGRVKSVRRKPDFLDSLKKIKVEPIRFKVKNFQLMRSELTRNGPRYEIVEEF